MSRMSDGAPTLEDVARVAGVSRATVSRVVNGIRNVDTEIQQAVRRAIEQTGYAPNRAARSLVTRRTGAVALVVSGTGEPDGPVGPRVFGDPFFGRVVGGVVDFLRGHAHAPAADAGRHRPGARGRGRPPAAGRRGRRAAGDHARGGPAAGPVRARPRCRSCCSPGPRPRSRSATSTSRTGRAGSSRPSTSRPAAAGGWRRSPGRSDCPRARTAWRASATRWPGTARRTCRTSRATSPTPAARRR